MFKKLLTKIWHNKLLWKIYDILIIGTVVIVWIVALLRPDIIINLTQ